MAISNYNEKLVKPFTEYFRAKGVTINGVCGMLGNIYAESKLYPNNLQNSYNTKLGMTDEEYTLAVDSGLYTNFATDKAGYGLCQWTSSGRKQGLLNLANSMGTSIGYYKMQFEWLYEELTHSYKSVWAELINPNNSISSCARIFMLKFERPKNQSEANQLVRVGYAQEFYDKYFKTEKYYRSVYMNQMRSFLGAADGNDKHKEIVDIYNSYLPHPRGHKLTMNDAWCAATVSAAAIAVKYTAIYPIECSCTQMMNIAKSMGIWEENDNYSPKPADLILYDWEASTGECTGQPNHIGAVESCSDGKITAIEGNYDGKCQRRTIPIGWRYIRGFICPKYNTEPAPTPKVTTYVVQKNDNLTKIAKEYNCTVDDILKLNPQITDKNKIYVGQKILVPIT